MNPRGLGFFLASGDQDPGNGGRVLERMRAAGADWCALWIEAPDGRRPKTTTLVEYASAARAMSITPWLWTFPDSEKDAPEKAAEWAGQCLAATGAAGLILDVEEPYKGEPDAAKRLVKASLDALTERHGIGVTSYPYGHPTIPWAELAVGFGMPQLYRSAESVVRVDRALAWYAERHTHVMPIAASYLGDADRLRADLRRICLDKHGHVRVPGVGIWAWGTTDAREREVTEQASRWW